jgi:glycerol kinase
MNSSDRHGRILALDQSTSATKALLYDVTGSLIDKESLDHRQIYPQPGWVEHDAEEIWQNTVDVVRRLVGRNTPALDRLRCLSVTNQRETIVVFDRRTGRPLHNAVVWQCRRGDPICSALVDGGYGEEIRRKTGLKIDTYFSAPKLKWLVENRPEIRAKLAGGEALAGTIDAYLVYRLTGGRTFATDATNASRTLLFDVGRNRWDEALTALFEVPRHALAEVYDSDAVFGETNVEGVLPRPIPICGVMGDSQASLFAQRCFEPGMAKVTLGTGSSVLLNVGSELRVTESGAVTTIAWRLGGRSTYCFEGIINYSAATIEWLKNQLGLIDTAGETEALAASVDDNGGVYLVPAFAGLSAPYWSRSARAAILGLTAHSTKAHVVRAALESIAYRNDAARRRHSAPPHPCRRRGGRQPFPRPVHCRRDRSGA